MRGLWWNAMCQRQREETKDTSGMNTSKECTAEYGLAKEWWGSGEKFRGTAEASQ